MLGYIQALIDNHVRKFEEAEKRNDRNFMRYEKHFIEELEGLRKFYLTQGVESGNDSIVVSIDGELLGNMF